ncbi:MAG TPA: AI-2E family transporter [Bryobacteraceae bacterium]|nr:AI-2E family transporter [Bryobacteraceae bacterium]
MVIGTRNEKAADTARDRAGSYALTIVAGGVIIAILYLGRVVFITAIAAVIIALILEPFVSLLVRIRFPRGIASFVVCVFALLAVYFAGLGVYSQLSSIASDVPAFKEHLTTFIGSVSDRIQKIEDSSARILIPARPQNTPPPAPAPQRTKKSRKAAPPAPVIETPPGFIPEVRIHEDRNPITDYVYARLGTLYKFILMTSFVPLLVYFMLSWRDHVYKSFLRFFDGSDRITASRSLQGIAGMARAFVVGNFMIGVILAVLSSAILATIRLPYPVLVGSLSGFLSLVPYAGIVLALVPPVLAALATGAPSAVLLIAGVTVVGLHLIAMNILYPTLVGARVHLNPLIVTLSLMFWGFLWDAAGLVLAIPITAGLKAVCDNVAGLRKYGRFLGD